MRAPAPTSDGGNGPTKLHGKDIAHIVKAMLEMDDRGFTPTACLDRPAKDGLGRLPAMVVSNMYFCIPS